MEKTARTVLKIEWQSLLALVQAAKFKDVGNSTWTVGNGQSVLLASPQCFANLLEAVAFVPGPEATLLPCLKDMPYVRLVDGAGQYLASSLDLPHRVASGHIAYSRALKMFRQRLQSEIDEVGIYQAVFRFCPMSLLHGVYFIHFPNKDRITRAISGSIVGQGAVTVTIEGTVKDPIAASANAIEGLRKHYNIGAGKPSTAGLGNILTYEAQYVCERIETKLNIDHRLIDSYCLPAEATKVMHLLALWKAAKLVNEPLRVRSGCDLLCETVEAVIGEVPELSTVEHQLKKALAAAKKKGLLAERKELEFELPLVVKPGKVSAVKAAEQVTATEEEAT